MNARIEMFGRLFGLLLLVLLLTAKTRQRLGNGQPGRQTMPSMLHYCQPVRFYTTKYKDPKAIAGQIYYYRVVAENNVGLSGYSNVVTTP
jgi:hypothetical protein